MGALILTGGALYIALASPAPTSARLIAAAKASYGESLGQRAKQELCLSNMDYSANPFNAAEHDRNTLAWLDTLVMAGLYSPGTTVTQSGFFSRTIVQYRATPELAQWRDGRRLCLGKNIAIADVVEIGKPTQETLGQGADSATVQTVSAQLLLQATDAAPWLDKTEVQGPVLERLSEWKYQGGKLQKQTAEVFGLHQGQWMTGQAYKAELQKQYAAARRTDKNRAQSTSTASSGEGFFASLGQLFSFGGHPLEGTWRIETAGVGGGGLFGGMQMPDDANLIFKFTSDSIDIDGEATKCRFEVEGKRVTVTTEGNEVLVFEMRDKDTAVMDIGFIQLTYKRAS